MNPISGRNPITGKRFLRPLFAWGLGLVPFLWENASMKNPKLGFGLSSQPSKATGWPVSTWQDRPLRRAQEISLC